MCESFTVKAIRNGNTFTQTYRNKLDYELKVVFLLNAEFSVFYKDKWMILDNKRNLIVDEKGDTYENIYNFN